VFGLNEALMSFIRRQVGLRTDAASSTGSLHAKVGDVKSYLINTIYSYLVNTIFPRFDYFKSKQPRFVVSRCDAGQTTTVLQITGAGYLTGITVAQESPGGSVQLRITIDGVIRVDGITPSLLPLAKGVGNYATAQNSIAMLHRFNSSLRVDINSSAASVGYAYVSYLLD